MLGSIGEAFKDLGERALETIGVVEKDKGHVGLSDGKLRHNIDLEGFSSEQRAQIEVFLTDLATELDAIDAELDSPQTDPGRRAMLQSRKAQIESQLTDVKWELEHQNFNFGKMFFGNLVVPGGGFIAQGIGFDGDERMENALSILSPSPEQAGVASPAGELSGGETPASDGLPSVDWLMKAITNDPEAFMDAMKRVEDPADRQLLMTALQTKLQDINQMTSMMANFQKAMHDTNKAVINNFRV